MTLVTKSDHIRTIILTGLILALAACSDSSNSAAPTTPPTDPGTPPTDPGTTPGDDFACTGTFNFEPAPVQRQLVTHLGRQIAPLGELVDVGNFPSGGAITPDGRFYWALDAGRDEHFAWIIELAPSGDTPPRVLQKLPLPGSSGQAVFSPDGTRAYISGVPDGGNHEEGTELVGTAGDVIHVFDIDVESGLATELAPLNIPSSAQPFPNSASRLNQSIAGGGPDPSFTEWPKGLAITPDGNTLVAALLNSDRAAIIDIANNTAEIVNVGTYPHGVAIERSGQFAYVSSEGNGSLSKIDIANASVVATIPLNLGQSQIVESIPLLGNLLADLLGRDNFGDSYAHPQEMLADPEGDRIFIAVTNRDVVGILNTQTDEVERLIPTGRPEGIGTSPVGMAVSPDGCTLYVANANENAILAYALKDRPTKTFNTFDLVGRIPTGDYPTDIQVSADGTQLVWLAGKGMGSNAAPEGQSSPDRSQQSWQRGIVGVLNRPNDAYFAEFSPLVSNYLQTGDRTAPQLTPVHGAPTGPFTFERSQQIKHVFLVVRENRTYDQILGAIPRGDGDTRNLAYTDNCIDNPDFEGTEEDRHHPGCGVTPNAHALARDFPLLDHFMANSEQSIDGHILSTGGWVIDYSQRNLHAQFRGRPYDHGIYPISFPPNYFLFDQVEAAGLSQRIYGERSGGLNPEIVLVDPRATAGEVLQQLRVNIPYPFNGLEGCLQASENFDPAPLFAGCIFDSGNPKLLNPMTDNVPPAGGLSRINIFNLDFQAMLLGEQLIGEFLGVPDFTYIILFNDHTTGRTNSPSRAAGVADNDLALGQFVELISNSPIWPESAIFVMEDDSQAGSDHVDSHRMPGFVISPWVKRGKHPAISTRYDQYSMIRTIQMILGLEPSSLHHALATPMYDVFIDPSTESPDFRPYQAILPQKSLLEQNGKTAEDQALRIHAPHLLELQEKMPWHETDLTPQPIVDRLIYAQLWGDDEHYPGVGPNASKLEVERSNAVMDMIRRDATAAEIEAFLENTSVDDD